MLFTLVTPEDMKLLTTLSVLKMPFGLGTSLHLNLQSHTHSSGHSMYLGFLQVPVLGLVFCWILSTHTSLTTMALHPPNANPQIKIYSLQHSSKPQIQRAPSLLITMSPRHIQLHVSKQNSSLPPMFP